jgi:hypothetical protein
VKGIIKEKNSLEEETMGEKNKVAREAKKPAAKTLMEKRKEKQAKKEEKKNS